MGHDDFILPLPLGLRTDGTRMDPGFNEFVSHWDTMYLNGLPVKVIGWISPVIRQAAAVLTITQNFYTLVKQDLYGPAIQETVVGHVDTMWEWTVQADVQPEPWLIDKAQASTLHRSTFDLELWYAPEQEVVDDSLTQEVPSPEIVWTGRVACTNLDFTHYHEYPVLGLHLAGVAAPRLLKEPGMVAEHEGAVEVPRGEVPKALHEAGCLVSAERKV